MANYDSWKATEPGHDRIPRQEKREWFTCSDCRQHGDEGFKGVSVTGKVLCDDCWRWRAARMLEFDPRTRQQITAALQQGAA